MTFIIKLIRIEIVARLLIKKVCFNVKICSNTFRSAERSKKAPMCKNATTLNVTKRASCFLISFVMLCYILISRANSVGKFGDGMRKV